MVTSSKVVSFLTVILSLVILSSCQSLKQYGPKKTALISMSAGVLIGGALGATVLKPETGNSLDHGAYWAGISGVGAGVGALLLTPSKDLATSQDYFKKFQSQEDKEKLKKNAAKLMFASDDFKKLPKQIREKLKNRKWEFSQVDRWSIINEDTIEHSDLIVELKK